MTENPAFDDCALPEGCECRRRGVSMLGVKKCLVPDINATAAELGWQVPYEVETLGELLASIGSRRNTPA